MLNIGIGQGLAQGFVELVQHYHGFYIGIIKLVHQLAHCVHGVGVNHYQAQFPGGNDHHRILNKIGQLNGNAVPWHQLELLLKVAGNTS